VGADGALNVESSVEIVYSSRVLRRAGGLRTRSAVTFTPSARVCGLNDLDVRAAGIVSGAASSEFTALLSTLGVWNAPRPRVVARCAIGRGFIVRALILARTRPRTESKSGIRGPAINRACNPYKRKVDNH
jgi:hypothetical protein